MDTDFIFVGGFLRHTWSLVIQPSWVGGASLYLQAFVPRNLKSREQTLPPLRGIPIESHVHVINTVLQLDLYRPLRLEDRSYPRHCPFLNKLQTGLGDKKLFPPKQNTF